MSTSEYVWLVSDAYSHYYPNNSANHFTNNLQPSVYNSTGIECGLLWIGIFRENPTKRRYSYKVQYKGEQARTVQISLNEDDQLVEKVKKSLQQHGWTLNDNAKPTPLDIKAPVIRLSNILSQDLLSRSPKSRENITFVECSLLQHQQFAETTRPVFAVLQSTSGALGSYSFPHPSYHPAIASRHITIKLTDHRGNLINIPPYCKTVALVHLKKT